MEDAAYRIRTEGLSYCFTSAVAFDFGQLARSLTQHRGVHPVPVSGAIWTVSNEGSPLGTADDAAEVRTSDCPYWLPCARLCSTTSASTKAEKSLAVCDFVQNAKLVVPRLKDQRIQLPGPWIRNRNPAKCRPSSRLPLVSRPTSSLLNLVGRRRNTARFGEAGLGTLQPS